MCKKRECFPNFLYAKELVHFNITMYGHGVRSWECYYLCNYHIILFKDSTGYLSRALLGRL